MAMKRLEKVLTLLPSFFPSLLFVLTSSFPFSSCFFLLFFCFFQVSLVNIDFSTVFTTLRRFLNFFLSRLFPLLLLLPLSPLAIFVIYPHVLLYFFFYYVCTLLIKTFNREVSITNTWPSKYIFILESWF